NTGTQKLRLGTSDRELPNLSSYPDSVKSPFSHITFFQASVNVIYPALVVDKASMCCKLAFKLHAHMSIINPCPVIDLLMTVIDLPMTFETTAEVFDISNLNIEIKTKPQFSSPNVDYGVFLVFKFFDSRSFSSKPMYVNLKYRKGNKSQHAYFATWRDKEWMMIELDRYSNQKEDDVVFEFLLESFSSCHCGDGAIYVEGIEFRAIGKPWKAKHLPIDPIYIVFWQVEIPREDLDEEEDQELHTWDSLRRCPCMELSVNFSSFNKVKGLKYYHLGKKLNLGET
ncbi:kinase-like domain, phloem protein 2-like protein, partial [Tanacetum coccineum]